MSRPAPAECSVRPLADGDLPAALDLICRTWPEVPRSSHRAMARDDPWRERGRIFGAFVGGALASHARLHYRPIRVGAAVLEMIGVSSVVTDERHRRRGLGHLVLRAALAWMRGAGAHVCLLNTGVPDFYAPLGWGRLSLPYLSLAAGGIPRLGAGRWPVVRLPISPARAELLDIYRAACARHPIALQRTREYWERWPRWAAGSPWVGLLDDEWSVVLDDDQMIAYGGIQRSMITGGALSIGEACALPGREETLPDLCDDLVARARAAGAQRIELNLPADHPLSARLAPYGEWMTHRGVMAQVLDLPGLLRALVPEVERRAAGLARPAVIRLESPAGEVTMEAGPAGVAIGEARDGPVVRLTAGGLAALLLGLSGPADLREAGELEGEEAASQALARLFPCLHSHYSQVDGL